MISRFNDAFGSEMKRLIPGSSVRIFDDHDFMVEVRDETPTGTGRAFQIFTLEQVLDARVNLLRGLEDLGRRAQNHRTTDTHIRALVEDLNSEGHKAHYLTHTETLLVVVKEMLQIDFNIKKLYWSDKLVSRQIWDDVDKIADLRAPKIDWRLSEMIPEDYYQ